MADWKTDLQKAYRSSAKWAVKDSNKTFDKTISDTGRDALTRGLGRSSYTTQTLANLQTDKNEAGNRIRSEFELEYLKELQQRELEEEKLAEQKRQFDLQMGLTGGGGGGGYGGRGGSNGGNGNPGNNSDYDPTGMFTRNAGYNIGSWFLNGVNNVGNNVPKPVAGTPFGNINNHDIRFSGDTRR